MNLHMKSAKHVKMNRTSFVSQHFFKCLQQIGETEMLSRILGEKCTLDHVQMSIAIFFNFEKKVWCLIFIQNAN